MKKLSLGEELMVEGRGGWVYRIIGAGDGADIEASNPVEGGGEKFFTFSTVGNPYGAGKIIQERSLGIATEYGRVVGALVLDTDGKVAERFSWSNSVYMKKQTVEIAATGELFVGGVSKGYLAAVFLPDKNRLDGYVGIFKPTRPEMVKVLEMEDLLLASI